MTEQTKAVFENPQLLRQKLGEFLRTDDSIKIEKFAVTAQKCFAKGGKVSLGFSISWSWWSLFLGIIPLVWRKNYLQAFLWWALYFVTIGFSTFILPCFYKYFIIKRFEKALDGGDEQFVKMSGTSLLAVFIALLLPIIVIMLIAMFSVAIPRLASTRADAEIAYTMANMRTLLSDASAYHVQTGNFYGVKYRDFTNVRVSNIDTVALNNEVFLPVNGTECIGIKLKEQNGNYSFKFYPNSNTNDTCEEVLNSPTVKTFLEDEIKIGSRENDQNPYSSQVSNNNTKNLSQNELILDCDKQDALSCRNLALMYKNEIFVAGNEKQNQMESLRLFDKGCSLGDAKSCEEAWRMYIKMNVKCEPECVYTSKDDEIINKYMDTACGLDINYCTGE